MHICSQRHSRPRNYFRGYGQRDAMPKYTTNTSVCCLNGCGKPMVCRNLCGSHYKLWPQLSDVERAALMKPPAIPHWEYEPTPDQVAELIEQHGDEPQK